MTHLQELFIKNLRFLRTKANFTQLEFSEKIGVSPNYLNAVENGKNFPSPEVIQKIVDTLKILPYQLFVETQIESNSGNFSSEQMQKIQELKTKIDGLFLEML